MTYKNDDFNDFEFEDVIGDAEIAKKKKKNSDDKGHRGERNLSKLLKKRFNMEFSRTVGSGNRWGQVLLLPKFAQNVYSGDILPENEFFKFVIECKDGYGEIDLHVCFERGIKKIDEWMQQSLDEHLRCGRLPIICWKKDYKPWLAMVREQDIEGKKFKYLLHYKDWCIIDLNEFLNLPDEFFFNVKKSN
jgi:hypothetical protein